MDKQITNETGNISVFVKLVDDKDIVQDKTLLDVYLKQELDNLLLEKKKHQSVATDEAEDENTTLWKDVKEQLGINLFTRDLEISYYKNKCIVHSVINLVLGISVIGVYIWKK